VVTVEWGGVCGGEGRCLAERANPALVGQIIERTQGFFARRFGIGDMHLIQIEIVGLQTRQAFLRPAPIRRPCPGN
jgi:hypothetical protein